MYYQFSYSINHNNVCELTLPSQPARRRRVRDEEREKKRHFQFTSENNLIAHFKYFRFFIYLLSTSNVKCTFKCDFEVILCCQQHSIVSLQYVLLHVKDLTYATVSAWDTTLKLPRSIINCTLFKLLKC